jgi:hypothetical protein
MRRSLPFLDMIDLWLPGQRPIGEEPEVMARCMSGEELVDDSVVILLGVIDDARFWTRILQHTMNLRHKAGRERNLTGRHRITPLQRKVPPQGYHELTAQVMHGGLPWARGFNFPNGSN